jgi:spermidine synthase
MIDAIAHDASLFRFMRSCAPDAKTVLGDGRLTLATAEPGLDLLLLDTFSSDAVPMHMLTREAFALYKSRLGPQGVLLVNISNRNMELADAVAASAAANGMVTARELDLNSAGDSRDTMRFQSEIVLVAQSQTELEALKLGPAWHRLRPSPDVRVWTDDYSNVLDAILAKRQSRAFR